MYFFVELIPYLVSVLNESLSIAVVISLFALLTLYGYTTRNHDYWKKRGIPGPRPLPVLGNSLDNFLDSVAYVDVIRCRQYGKVHGYYEGNKPYLLVAEPDLVKSIAVKDWHLFINRGDGFSNDRLLNTTMVELKDGHWKRMRSIISPTLSSGKLRQMFPDIEECANETLESLNSMRLNESEINLKEIFGAYVMDVVVRCAFGVKTNSHLNRDEPFVKHCYKFFELSLLRLIAVSILPNFIQRAFDIDIIAKDVRNFLKSACFQIIKQRKESGQRRCDFLQSLIDGKATLLKHSDSVDENMNSVTAPKEVSSFDAKLNDEEIVPQMILFMTSAYETAASLLTSCAYCLATHPDCQDRLYQELKATFDKGDPTSFDVVQNIEYLNAVIEETMRLWSPAAKHSRRASEDYPLPSVGIVVEKGTTVELSFHAIHQDPDNFPNPESFIPDRFLKENLAKIKPYTYLPFGIGPRYCIGKRFALVEAKLILCKILMKYKVVATSNTKIPLEVLPHPESIIPKRLIVQLQKR